MEAYTPEVPEAAIQAYHRLVQLNLELHKPEVEKWLHSEEAEPALKEMLVNVPCLGQIQ
jgi:hypothetical protein